MPLRNLRPSSVKGATPDPLPKGGSAEIGVLTETKVTAGAVAAELGSPRGSSKSASVDATEFAELGSPSYKAETPLVDEKAKAEAGIPLSSSKSNVKSTAECGVSGPSHAKDDFRDDGPPAEHGATDGTERTASTQWAQLRPPGAYSMAPGRSSVLIVSTATMTGSVAADEGASAHVIVPSSPPDDEVVDGENVIATAVDDASAIVYAKTVHKDKSMLIKAGACIVAFVGVIVGITVGVVVGRENSNVQATTAQISPAWKECVPPKEGEDAPISARFREIMRLVGSESVYSESEDTLAPVTEPCSPQNRALTWLADDDGMLIPSSFSYRFELEQRFALATLFFSCNGTDWTDASEAHWLTGVHECEWKGVTCDEEIAKATGVAVPEGKVTSITLPSGNNVGGRLPPEIGFLLYLTSLEIGRNPLSGPIPKEVSKLFLLETLHITSTSISGTIPEELFSGELMPKLKRLTLADNELSGHIPEIVGDSMLRIISLGNNRIHGTIPSSLVKMKGLGHLMLPNNELTGPLPRDLSKLNKTLAILDVTGNKLNGTLPELATLEYLLCLGLGDNRFHGEFPVIPECLGQLNIDGFSLSEAVSEATCSHFEQLKDKGAHICGGSTVDCTCCKQECKINNGFCKPGREARLPGKCALPPNGKPPPGAKPQRPDD